MFQGINEAHLVWSATDEVQSDYMLSKKFDVDWLGVRCRPKIRSLGVQGVQGVFVITKFRLLRVISADISASAYYPFAEEFWELHSVA
jgi:hypothetical protein